MAKLLDDHKFHLEEDLPLKKKEPQKLWGVLSLVIFLFLFIAQITRIGTSETALVQGSYFWMPFLVMGFSGFILPPRKVLWSGLLTILGTFVFYILIWPAL